MNIWGIPVSLAKADINRKAPGNPLLTLLLCMHLHHIEITLLDHNYCNKNNAIISVK